MAGPGARHAQQERRPGRLDTARPQIRRGLPERAGSRRGSPDGEAVLTGKAALSAWGLPVGEVRHADLETAGYSVIHVSPAELADEGAFVARVVAWLDSRRAWMAGR